MHSFLVQMWANIANFGPVLIFATYPVASMVMYYNRRDRERSAQTSH